MTDSQYDYIVIGSGAAGAASVWRLCSKGYKVACLERGKEMNPSQYPSTGSNWELRKQFEFNPVSSIRSSDADYPVDDDNSPIAVCNFNALGGSTILYSGHFPRFQPQDFKIRSIDGLYEDWPISYEDLKPYYEINEYEMSVSGLVGDPMYPDIKNLLPPVPMGKTGELIANAFNKKKWHWWLSPSAISTTNSRGRNSCINLGPCNTGCPQGAKSSTDITYILKARKMNLKLYTECYVDSIIVENDKAVGVIYFQANGEKKKLFAKKIILAASAIGTPRILLNSINKSGERGIANSSGLVGKNLMIHPLGYVEGVFEETLDTDIGPQGCMIYSLEHYRDKENNYDLGFMMHVLRGTGPIETALSSYKKRKLRFGQNLEDDFNIFFKKQLSISVICDDLPQITNYLELSDEKDKFGTPGVKINYKLSENTSKMMKDGMAKAKEVMKLAGAKKTYAFGPVRNTGWHLMGTCKMGDNPKNSVVNANGETHDIKDLYVVDSSCFVTGSCVNPANTIQAVALYLTDAIIEKS